MRRTAVFVPFLLGLVVLAGCSVNPVTGERNLNFMSENWERTVGAENYAPMRQAQGGDLKIDPDLTEYVSSVGQQLAEHAQRPLDYEFEVLNNSVPNAWALPGGKISINRGLLTELDSEAELAAVLGHEIVHADAAHGARAQSKGVLTQVGALAGAVALGSTVESRTAQQLGMLGIQLGAALITTKYGRDAEREADEYGMRYMSAAGYDPQGAVHLQETFVRLSEGRRTDWLSGLFASHPPSQERVENNRATAAALPPGGDLGRDRYQQKIRRIKELEPAYKAHDDGRKALAEGEVDRARRLARQAIDAEPQEALFHSLLGDTYAAEEDYRDAEAQYSRAIGHDGEFFYHYLRRGLVRQELNRRESARADLQRSLELLPTSQANLALGNMARDSGNRQRAIAYYQAAAQSDSGSGRQATIELARMDPLSFLAVGVTADGEGNGYAQLQNRAPADMRNVRLKVEFMGADGRIRVSQRTVPSVPAGQTINVPLRIGGFTSMADLQQRLRVTALGARVSG
ncbi:MAG: M48 family metalloprotease [Xanthomonadales bacterium]|nr:M48 family metalloprotease [Xanthomonadales bacterium]